MHRRRAFARIISAVAGLAFGLLGAELTFGQLRPDEGRSDAVLYSIEVRNDGHAVAMVHADGRTLPIRFTFDEGKIARGQDVRMALTYVEKGEAEAAIVYATDVPAAKNVIQVYEFDPALHDEIVYVLVLLKKGESNPAAKELFEFLQSPEADATYRIFGFERISAAAKPK